MTSVESLFSELNPTADFVSLRYVEARNETVRVRNDVLEPLSDQLDVGAMITVAHAGGLGYAATSDVSASGLRQALERAQTWAERTAGRSVVDFSSIEMPTPSGEYRTDVRQSWDSVPLGDRIALLKQQCAALNLGDTIVDRTASLWNTATTTRYMDNRGGRYVQEQHMLVPYLEVVANKGTETQTRTLAGRGCCRQGGWRSWTPSASATPPPRWPRRRCSCSPPSSARRGRWTWSSRPIR